MGEGFGVAETVLVRERSFEDVAEDFHVAMGVGGKTHARGDGIVVDDAQTAKAHVGGIEVVSETERVERFKPAMVGVSAFRGLPDDDVIGLDVASHVWMMRKRVGVCQYRLFRCKWAGLSSCCWRAMLSA